MERKQTKIPLWEAADKEITVIAGRNPTRLEELLLRKRENPLNRLGTGVPVFVMAQEYSVLQQLFVSPVKQGMLEDRLTELEKGLLNLVGQGMTNREIATAKGVSQQTIKNELSSIYKKLKVRKRTDALFRGLNQESDDSHPSDS